MNILSNSKGLARTTGLWDIKTDPKTRECAVPLHEYEVNVREMVRVAREGLLNGGGGGGGGAAGEEGLVVWVSTTPVDDHNHNVVFKQAWRRYNKDVVRYNDAAARVMASEGVRRSRTAAELLPASSCCLTLPTGPDLIKGTHDLVHLIDSR